MVNELKAVVALSFVPLPWDSCFCARLRPGSHGDRSEGFAAAPSQALVRFRRLPEAVVRVWEPPWNDINICSAVPGTLTALQQQ